MFLHRIIGERPAGIHTMEMSIVEIYNNEIRDLLSSDTNAKHEVIMSLDESMCLPTVTCRSVVRHSSHDFCRMSTVRKSRSSIKIKKC